MLLWLQIQMWSYQKELLESFALCSVPTQTEVPVTCNKVVLLSLLRDHKMSPQKWSLKGVYCGLQSSCNWFSQKRSREQWYYDCSRDRFWENQVARTLQTAIPYLVDNQELAPKALVPDYPTPFERPFLR